MQLKKVSIKVHYYFSYMITFILLSSIILNINDYIFSNINYSQNHIIELISTFIISYVFIRKYYKPSSIINH